MNENFKCPICKEGYHEENPPKKLITCEHNVCRKCLLSEIRTNCLDLVCPIDKKRFFLRKHGLNNFPDDTELIEKMKRSHRSPSPKRPMKIIDVEARSKAAIDSTKTVRISEMVDQSVLIKNSREVSPQKKSPKNRSPNEKKEKIEEIQKSTQGGLTNSNEFMYNAQKSSKNIAEDWVKSSKRLKESIVEHEKCLLHSKAADLVCREDGGLICSSCALFGEHKGHDVMGYGQIASVLTEFTEQVLTQYETVRDCDQNLQTQLREAVEASFGAKKAVEVKAIHTNCTKAIDALRKLERIAVASIDTLIEARKQELLSQFVWKQLQAEKNEFFTEVHTLGQAMDDLFVRRNMQEAFDYLDQKNSKSYLAQKGEYLRLQFASMQRLAQEIIERQATLFGFSWDSSFEAKTNIAFEGKICNMFLKLSEQEKEIFDMLRVKSSGKNQIRESVAKDEVCDKNQLSQQEMLLNSDCKQSSEVKQNIGNYHIQGPLLVVSVQPQPQFEAEPLQSPQRGATTFLSIKPRESSRSKRRPTSYDRNKSIDGKRKGLQMPEKYRAMLEDLRNDRNQVIDFGGAELGDAKVQMLMEHVAHGSRIRSLKLFKNKLSDQILGKLLFVCRNIPTLNLAQNNFSDRALDIIEQAAYAGLGELKNITLSLNKINGRTVKEKLKQLQRKGIFVSI